MTTDPPILQYEVLLAELEGEQWPERAFTHTLVLTALRDLVTVAKAGLDVMDAWERDDILAGGNGGLAMEALNGALLAIKGHRP